LKKDKEKRKAEAFFLSSIIVKQREKRERKRERKRKNYTHDRAVSKIKGKKKSRWILCPGSSISALQFFFFIMKLTNGSILRTTAILINSAVETSAN
jgi:hypothetical protein